VTSLRTVARRLLETNPDCPGEPESAIATLLGCALAASAAVVALLMVVANLRLAPESLIPYAIAAGVMGLLRFGLPATRWRHAHTVSAGAEYYTVFGLMALMGAVSTYPIAGLSHGLHDAALERVDEALGFDWLAWYRTVADHRWLQIAGTAAYRSIYLSPALLLGYFALNRQRTEAYRFLAGFWLAAVITLLAYPMLPALGPLSYLWHGPIPYMPESGVWQADLIPPLRAEHVRWIDLTQLHGLVEAPSFHAAAATLYIATGWRIASLRWPLFAVNGAMLLSTPIEGTHYFIDLLLGALVAMVAMLLIDALPGARGTRALGEAAQPI